MSTLFVSGSELIPLLAPLSVPAAGWVVAILGVGVIASKGIIHFTIGKSEQMKYLVELIDITNKINLFLKEYS